MDTDGSRSRGDRLLAGGAFVLVVILAGIVALTVLDAQRRGREALERNEAAILRQIAGGMNQRVESSLASLAGLTARPFAFKVGDAADQARLDALQSLNPTARSGFVLIDRDRRLTAGTLLVDKAVIGTVVDRPGLDEALASGKSTLLPAAPSLTTPLRSMGILVPSRSPDGRVIGAMLLESIIAADSDFNREIAQLRQGRTGVYLFVDELDTIVVATDEELLGTKVTDYIPGRVERGLHHIDELVVGRADVPSAGWRLIFTQDLHEFESGLGRSVQTALLLIVVVALIGGGLGFIVILRRLRAERAERRRIAAINETREEFISIVSHELRTPVAGIAGFLESAMEHWGVMDEDARFHAIARARANARRLQVLTRDVLDTSAAEAGEFVYAFDLMDLDVEVDAAVIAARETDDRELRLVRAPRPAWVRADPDRIHQVLVNLIDNAIRNSPRDGAIDIEVAASGADVVVSVRDHGAGVNEEDRETMFEKWARGRSVMRGNGLGLYVARRIVEAHGGRIWVENAPGGGAVFRFAVPQVTAGAASVSA